MKKFRLFLIFVVFMSIPFSSFALNCPYDKLSRLKSIAQNILYDYNYTENNGNINFSIRFFNVHPEIMIQDVTHNKTYYYKNTNNGILTISDFSAGTNNKFIIYATDNLSGVNVYTYWQIENGISVKKEITSGVSYDCEVTELHNLYIQIPSYNNFYTSDICKKYSNNKRCSKWYNHSLTYEKFEQEIINDEEMNEKKENTESNEITNRLLDFIKQNIITICVFSLVIIVVCVWLIIKKKKDGFEGW